MKVKIIKRNIKTKKTEIVEVESDLEFNQEEIQDYFDLEEIEIQKVIKKKELEEASYLDKDIKKLKEDFKKLDDDVKKIKDKKIKDKKIKVKKIK